MTDPTVTSVNKIKVSWLEIAEDGSSEITSYSLEIDDGTGGEFTPVIGYLTEYLKLEYTITSNIVKGTLYRLRYRALNKIGWGNYSPIAYVRAANIPTAPLQLSYISSTTDTVTLSLPRSMDNGGSPITHYKLYVDEGDDFTSSFSEVPSYNGQDVEFTSNAALDGLVTGKTYRFKTCAVNEYGDSDFSFEVIVGVGADAPAPGVVFRDSEF